jgi:hypothetical protein
MNYTKPEVAVLGNAVCVIENTHAKDILPRTDFGQKVLNPAYDLDE